MLYRRWRVINRNERSPATVGRGGRRASYNHASTTDTGGGATTRVQTGGTGGGAV